MARFVAGEIVPEIGACATISSTEDNTTCLEINDNDSAVKPSVSSTQTQTTSTCRKLSIEELSLNPNMLQYYTGLDDYEHINFVLNTLGPGRFSLKYYRGAVRNISIENQFLITLIRLRRYMPYIEISYLINTTGKTVSNIIITWINFMYSKWSALDMWPSKKRGKFL